MSATHTSRERIQLFSMGWRRGAAMKAIPENVRDDVDFQNGYRRGRTAYSAAMELARREYGASLPSFLKTEDHAR